MCPDPNPNPDPDRNHAIEVIHETVIVEDTIPNQSRYRNLDPDRSHRPGLDLGQEAIPVVNDPEALKINHRHYQDIMDGAGNLLVWNWNFQIMRKKVLQLQRSHQLLIQA